MWWLADDAEPQPAQALTDWNRWCGVRIIVPVMVAVESFNAEPPSKTDSRQSLCSVCRVEAIATYSIACKSGAHTEVVTVCKR